MADAQCRVTVVGAGKRADVALPASAAIGEYIDSLAQLCGQMTEDTFPAAWSLEPPGGRPLPPTTSLAAAGITDGQLLYLCDVTAGEYDEPLVLEADEFVAGAAGRISGPRWDKRARAAATVVTGALWLAAAAVGWLRTGPWHGAVAGPLALAAGAVLVVLAWAARSGRMGIATPVRLVLALGAVPCLAVCGWFTGASAGGGHVTAGVTGLCVGGVVGALAGLAAMPGIATLGAAVIVVTAGTTGGLLSALGATADQSATVVALLGFGLLVLAPELAGRICQLWSLLAREDDMAPAVVRAYRLMIAGDCVASLALAVALAVAGLTASPYAAGFTACLSCAVLLRAGSYRFLAGAVPPILAGATGLYVITLAAPRTVGAPAWLPPVAGLALGVAAVAAGAGMGFHRVALGDKAQEQWPAWARLASVTCAIAALPLAAGMFGLFGTMMSMGRHV